LVYWVYKNLDFLGVTDMAENITVKPGEIVDVSGQYSVPGGKETTLVKGNPAPPTPKPGQHFTLVDPTKHKS
jgi:hypothetical protein